jgi:cystathionine beta-lyase
VSSSVLVEHLLSHYGVWLNDGEMYGERDRSFVRINLACPRATLAEGLRRMAEGIAAL